MAPRAHDVRCVAHVHSTHSDGTATVPEIVSAARAHDVRVVLLTDHDTLAAREAGEHGWHDDVLVVVGHEVSPRAGHLLAFGLDAVVPHEGRTEAEICADVAARGGFGVAAHPFSEGSRMSTRIGRPHPWTALDAAGCAGIELWSLTTDAAEAWRSPREAVRFLRDPLPFLHGPPSRHLRLWDELSRRRPTAAIGGLDAHQPGLRVRGRIFSPMRHERYFGLLHTQLHLDRPLVGDAETDTAAVLEAVRGGRATLALTAFGDPAGFAFWAESDDATVPAGGRGPAGRQVLRVRLPRPARMVFVHDGRPVAEAHGTEAELAVGEPGVWRVEARLMVSGTERTWLVPNPVHLR